ncbi:two pore calcium channel protein 1-like isoform X2 [Corticium candelabrum]|uniref:two pore calcium channel protein 1-like isoform X2 n=1 Tax=Corticium candelabrum TaxID=121492 RepID=UPI002E261B40|nr:two pore calcium channel protein 1-like isoform X2 [Corticium candelabrum]
MSSRDRSPAPSIDSMQLEDVELGEKGSEEKRHDRPIVRSFLTNEKGRRVKLKRRSSLENFGRLGLLTPALALTPNVDEQDELTQSFTELQGGKRELILAAAHIDDALKGRGRYGKARVMFKPKFAQQCFAITNNIWFQRLMYIVIILHSSLVFVEPPSKDSVLGWVLALNFVCLMFYVVDVALTIAFMNWTVFWMLDENALNRGEFIFLILFTIDFILLVAQAISDKYIVQPFRLLRAAMLIFKAKNVAHIYRVLKSIVLKLGKVFVAIGLFIIMFAAVGVHVFMDDYQCDQVTSDILDCNKTSNQTLSGQVYKGAFDNVGIAALRLFVLITTENYPSLIFPTYLRRARSWFFFGAFIYIGVFILTAILLAIIVEAYWLYFKITVKEERYREREELAKAWNLLDPLANGDLPVEDPKFLSLFRILKPNHTDEENRQLIQLIDTEEDGFIDSYQWTTQLRDVMEAKFEHCGRYLFPAALDSLILLASRLVSSPRFHRVTVLLIATHAILFCMKWKGMSDNADKTIQALKTVIVSLFCVEILLRSLTWTTAIIHDYFELIDSSLVFVALMCNALAYPVSDMETERVLTVASGICVMGRLALNPPEWKRSVSKVLTSFVPVMWDLVILYLIVLFMFGVIGMEAFHNVDPHETVVNEYVHYNYQCKLGFIDFRCSLLMVFQLTTSSNWHELMNATMLSAGDAAALYFVVSFIFINLSVMNLFVAIAIEAFQKYGNRDTRKIDTDDLTWREKVKRWIDALLGSSKPEKQGKDEDGTDLKIRSPSTLPRSRQGSLRRSVDMRDTNGAAVVIEPATSDGEMSDDVYTGLTVDKRREVKMKRKMKKRKRAHRLAQKGLMVVRVMMAFRKTKDSEISLEQGEEVVVVDKVEEWMKGNKDDGSTGWFPSSHVCQLNQDSVRQPSANGSRAQPVSTAMNGETVKSKSSDINTTNTPNNNSSLFSNHIPLPGQSVESAKPVTKVSDMAAVSTSTFSTQNSVTPQLASHTSKPKLVMGKGGDWRRTIQDMTVMNPEEMHRLNKLLKKDMKASRIARRGARGNQVAPVAVTSSLETSLLEVVEEATTSQSHSLHPANQLRSPATVSMPSMRQPAISVEAIEESAEELPDSTVTQTSVTSNTLTVPGMAAESKPKKQTPGGEMPDWVKKFQMEHSVVVHEDGVRKGEKSDSSPGGSPSISRKNSDTSNRSSSPVIVVT